MRLPEMPALDSIVKPPVDQITYDKWFLKTVVVRSNLDDCQVTLIVRRYNYEKQLLSPDDADEKTIVISNVYALAQQYPRWRDVLATIVHGAGLAVQEDEFLSKVAVINQQIDQAKENDPEADLSALEAELAPLLAGLEEIKTQYNTALYPTE